MLRRLLLRWLGLEHCREQIFQLYKLNELRGNEIAELQSQVDDLRVAMTARPVEVAVAQEEKATLPLFVLASDLLARIPQGPIDLRPEETD